MDIRVIKADANVKAIFLHGTKHCGVNLKVVNILHVDSVMITEVAMAKGKVVTLPKEGLKVIYELEDGRSIVFNVLNYYIIKAPRLLYRFVLADEGKVTNRRNAIRVPIESVCTIKLDGISILCDINDVSNSGIGLLVKEDYIERFEIGKYIQGYFTYGKESKMYAFEGNVTRIASSDKINKRIIGVRFKQEYEAVQGLMMSVQREILRKMRKGVYS